MARDFSLMLIVNIENTAVVFQWIYCQRQQLLVAYKAYYYRLLETIKTIMTEEKRERERERAMVGGGAGNE